MRIAFIIFASAFLFSCAKKADWQCSCDIYTATSSTTETTQLQNMIKTDADSQCQKFGEDKAGKNGSYECSVK